MSARLSDVKATAKAWIAAALAGLTGLATVVVPDSTPGKLIIAAIGFLTALLAVFGKANAPASKPPADDYLG